MFLDERKRQVLQSIVEDYVASAEPVGSRTLVRKYHLGVSPATIRNEMADLEELGYLAQPHTSAGRVPSDLGYRYYVDELMSLPDLSVADLAQIRELNRNRSVAWEWVLQHAARLISLVTGYACVAFGATAFEKPPRLETLRLVPVDGQRVLLVLVTNQDHVEHVLLDLPEGVQAETLVQSVARLSNELHGLSLNDMSHSKLMAIAEELAARRVIYDRLLEVLEHALNRPSQEQVVLAGAANILGQPEFQDVERVRMLLSLLDRHDEVHEVLVLPPSGDGVRIVIGSEHPFQKLHDMSVVSARLMQGARSLGGVGVLGPTRMDYPRVVSVMVEVARALNRAWDDQPG